MDNLSERRPRVYKGADKVLKASLRDPITRQYIDLSSVDEIKAIFKKEDRTNLEKLLSAGAIVVSNASSGLITITLDETDTASLKEGKGQPVEILVLSNSSQDSSIGQNLMAIDVLPRI